MKTSPKQLPKHLEITEKLVIDTLYDFNPEQLNEIVHHIKSRFRKIREYEIEDMKKNIVRMDKKISYLQETLESL